MIVVSPAAPVHKFEAVKRCEPDQSDMRMRPIQTINYSNGLMRSRELALGRCKHKEYLHGNPWWSA